MQSYARFLGVICIFLYLTVNYTFPLHRDYYHYMNSYANTNRSQFCENIENQKHSVKHPFNRNPFNFRVKKKIKHLAQEGKPLNNLTKNINNVDLREYEQLVIMKKYPYLDIKELEMRYRPSGKHTRHSLTFGSSSNIEIAKIDDPSISELGEELLSVEIRNRGLSGFAIPPTTKQGVETKNSLKINAVNPQSTSLHYVKAPNENVMNSLKQDVSNYLNSRHYY